MMNETEIESCAKSELRAAVIATLKRASAAPVFGGALVERIHSADYAEDNATFCIMLDMADGTTAMLQVCPGRPITCCVVA